MNNIYPLTELEIPLSVIDKCSPLQEFAKDASIVTVELNNGTTINGVLIVSPNYVGAIQGENDLTFSPKDVVKISQTEDDLKTRSKSSWAWLYNTKEFSSQ